MPCGKLCWRQSVPKGRTSTPSGTHPPLPADGRAGGYHHQGGDKATVHHGGPLRRAWAESRLQRRGDRGGHASGEGISAGHVETELNSCFVIDEVGSRVAAAPSGERNGQLRHGERTKAAIAERQKFSALLKMLRTGQT